MVKETLLAYHVPSVLDYFTNFSALSEVMKNEKQYDLVFLGVFFDNSNGIDFARAMRKKGQQTGIIFLAISKDYAFESYDAAPICYLLKPIAREKLKQALYRALVSRVPQRLVFQTSKGIFAASMNEILYIESYDHTIYIHKTDGTRKTISATLSGLENSLPPMHFSRPHKSYIVNMTHISEIVRYQITLCDNIKIPIGKSRYDDIKKNFTQYAEQKMIS